MPGQLFNAQSTITVISGQFLLLAGKRKEVKMLWLFIDIMQIYSIPLYVYVCAHSCTCVCVCVCACMRVCVWGVGGKSRETGEFIHSGQDFVEIQNLKKT